VLGGIAFVGTMEPGAVVSVSKAQAVQADSPTRNIGTAMGTDVLGRTVSASSAADIAIVLGVTLERGPDLPRTGAPVSLVALAGLTLLVAGTALRAAGRRVED
jgi:LPXTG-motif cell wall-anchored protein